MDEKDIKILFERKQIEDKIKEVAKEITKNYKESDLLVICLLRGGFMFCSDLIKEMDIPVELDFMTTASYGDMTESSGVVEILQQPRVNVTNRRVLIVDDIADSGFTLKKIKEYVLERRPESVEVAVMINKPERRKTDIEPDYYCFEIPDLFIVGYGLDYKNYDRNKPYIYTKI